MGTYKNELSIEVKMYEPKEKKVTKTKNGGYIQLVGNASANVNVGEVEIFKGLYGSVKKFYKTQAEFDRNEATSLFVSYEIQNTKDWSTIWKPGIALNAMLEFETHKEFAKGYTVSDYNKKSAETLGMNLEDYTKQMKASLNAANKIDAKFTAPKAVKAVKGDVRKLEQELGL